MDEGLWQIIDEAVYRLYGASDMLALRTSFLRVCGELIPHAISFFDLVGDDRGHKVFFDPISLNMERADLDAYYRRFINVDYGSWIQEQPDIRPVYRDSDYLSDEVRRRSTLYRDWLEPMGVDYGCSVIVSFGGADYGTVTFARSTRQGDFTDEDLEVLRILERHLAQRMHQLAPQGITYTARARSIHELGQLYYLTPREIEVCRLLCQGVSLQRIGETLTIAPSTVRRHIANIYKKVGVGSRYELTGTVGKLLEG